MRKNATSACRRAMCSRAAPCVRRVPPAPAAPPLGRGVVSISPARTPAPFAPEHARPPAALSPRRRLRPLWYAGRIERLFSPICVLATPSDKAVPYFGGGMQYGPAALDVPQGLSAEKRVNCRLQKSVPSGRFQKGFASACALLRKPFCPLKKPAKAMARPTLPRSEERQAKAFCAAFLIIRLL